MFKILATLRFSLPEENTRSLNATQLGDSSETKIVLGSTAAKLKVSSDSKDEYFLTAEGTAVLAGLTAAKLGVMKGPDPDIEGFAEFNPKGVSVSYVPNGKGGSKTTAEVAASSSLTFAGTARAGGVGVVPDLSISGGPRKTTTQSVFTGTINVATGNYKPWFGKTGVLKYDSTSGKAILRIYDDE